MYNKVNYGYNQPQYSEIFWYKELNFLCVGA